MNVSELVAAASQRHGERAAIRAADGSVVTWAGLEDRVAATAAALQADGVGSGDRVAVALPNGAAFAAALWGALRAGAVAVPVNPAYTAFEIAHMLANAGVAAALADAPRARLLKTAAGQAGAAVTVLDADRAAGSVPGPGAGAPPTGGEDLALLAYTPGIVGRPVGACLRHRNLLANLEGFSELPQLGLRADDVLLGVPPFFHVFGGNVVLNAAARAGACIAVVERLDPASSIAAAAAAGVTVAYGAPPMYAGWGALPADAAPPLPGLRAAVSGADRLPAATWQRFAARFDVGILEGYGLTEAAPVVATNAAAPKTRPETVGPPIPGVEVAIAEADDETAARPPGEVGEIWVRGPNVFAGYHRAPEASAAALRGGWLRTGDRGSLDGDGRLRVQGRSKDLVIVSGFNVAPCEVEQALQAHPGVRDAGVCGLPDERTGERLRAAVVVGEPDLTADALTAHCRSRLARYKIPREIAFVETVPREPDGAVDRAALGRIAVETRR